MALTLVMCNEGWIPFDMAAAMVLGENIGTTITANLAAIVAGYQAKTGGSGTLCFASNWRWVGAGDFLSVPAFHR